MLFLKSHHALLAVDQTAHTVGGSLYLSLTCFMRTAGISYLISPCFCSVVRWKIEAQVAKAVETSKAKDDKRGSQVRMDLPRIAHLVRRMSRFCFAFWYSFLLHWVLSNASARVNLRGWGLFIFQAADR